MRTFLIAMMTAAFATVGLAEESAMHAASKQSGKKAPATKKTAPVLAQAPAPVQRTLSPLTTDSPLVSLAKRTKSARKMTTAKGPVIIDNDTVKKTKGVISEATANNNFNPPKPPGEQEGTEQVVEQEPAAEAEAPPAKKPLPQGKRTPQEIAAEQSYVNDQLNDPNPNDLDEEGAEKKMYELQQEQHEAQQPPPQ